MFLTYNTLLICTKREQMEFSKISHLEHKNNAKKYIEEGKLDEFKKLLNQATYTQKETRWEEVHDNSNCVCGGYDPSHYSSRSYEVDAITSYLQNPQDTKDFLNYALLNNQKEIIQWIWQSNKNLSLPSKPCLLFSKDYFEIFANANDYSKEGEIRNFSEVFDKLSMVQDKIRDLRSRGFIREAELAYKLANNIQTSMLNYVFSIQQPNALSTFKTECAESIKLAEESSLSQHRGWKDILLNLSLAIIGVGIVYLAAASVNYYKTEGKHFFFHTQTKSEEIVHDLSSTISSMNN